MSTIGEAVVSRLRDVSPPAVPLRRLAEAASGWILRADHPDQEGCISGAGVEGLAPAILEHAPMATTQEIQQHQNAARPKEDIAKFEGRWVALRNGHVVASGRSLNELRGTRGVRPEDTLRLVPRRDAVLIL